MVKSLFHTTRHRERSEAISVVVVGAIIARQMQIALSHLGAPLNDGWHIVRTSHSQTGLFPYIDIVYN